MGLFDNVPPARTGRPATGGLFANVPYASRQPEAPAQEVGALSDVLAGVLAPLPDPMREAAPVQSPDMVSPLARPDMPVAPVVDPAIGVLDESSLGGDFDAALLQAGQIIPGVRAGVALNDIRQGQAIEENEKALQARDMLVRMEAARPTIAPEDLPEFDMQADRIRQELAALEVKQAQPEYDTAMGRVADQQTEAMGTLAEALPEILRRSDEIAAIPMNPAAERMGQAETFGEGVDAFTDDPLGVLRTFGVRSLGTSVPSMLAAIAGSALGPAGAAVGAGATGAATEASMSVAQAMEAELRAAGVDVSSPEALGAFIEADPEAFDGVLQTALVRAGVIGSVDAATGGISGRLAANAAKSGRPDRIAAAVAAGGVVEPVGEGAGEAAAQLATTGEILPGEVLAEIAGGAGMGVPTTAGQVLVEAAKKDAPAQPVESATPPAAPQTPQEAPTPPQAPVMPEEAAVPAVAQPVQREEPNVATPEVPTPAPNVVDTPAQAQEPTAPQKRPLTYLVRKAGIQVDPDGAAGKELRANGITVKTNPGLFKRGGMTDLDNITLADNPELATILQPDDTGTYLSRQSVISALIEEANGRPVQNADQLAAQAAFDEWQGLQSEAAQDYVVGETRGQVVPAPADDIFAGPERTEIIGGNVDQELQTIGMSGMLTPEERSAIIGRLDRDGGSIEQAIEAELIRAAGDAEADQQPRGDIPGFEPEGRAPRDAARPDGRPAAGSEVVGLAEGRGAADSGNAGSAREGTAEGGRVDLTPEGEQRVIPGAERITDKERAERKAAEPKRGGDAAMGDDSLFGDPGMRGQDLFSEPAPDAANESRATAGARPAPTPEVRETPTPPATSGSQTLPARTDGRYPLRPGYRWTKPAEGVDLPSGYAEYNGLMEREYLGYLIERTRDDVDIRRLGEPDDGFLRRPIASTWDMDFEGTDGPTEAEIEALIESHIKKVEPAEPAARKSLPAPTKALPKPDSGSVEDSTGRKPKGKLSPRFMDFSFTNRPSVYGAAFRAAGIDPDVGKTMPMADQIATVKKALEERFGVKVDLAKVQVRKRNLVGRKVTVERDSNTTRENLDQLLDAFRQLQMLAHIMGLPEKAVALEIDGKPITISLVGRNRLGALGMFSWGDGKRTIHLPGRSNSFAHEWGHALDHYLGAQAKTDIKGMLSREMDERGVMPPLSPRRAIVESFANIMQALYGDAKRMGALVLELQRVAAEIGADGKPTAEAKRAFRTMGNIRQGKRPPAEYLNRYFETSRQYDQMSAAGGYFTDPAEMFARAFEAWVGTTAAAVSDLPQAFLSKGDWGYSGNADDRQRLSFPKGADLYGFGMAMSNLSQAVNRMNLFGNERANAPEDVDILSTNALLKRLPPRGLMSREAEGWKQFGATVRESSGRSEFMRLARAPFGAANAIGLVAFRSSVGAVHAMAKRQKNAEARKALNNIADSIGTRPGSGQFQKNTFQTDVEMDARQLERKLDGALARYKGGRSLTDDELSTLRTMLTEDGTRAPKNAPAGLAQLAAGMRSVLDETWYRLKDAGITVGYAPGFLPRITNVELVDADPTKFTTQAEKVYSLMFEREVIDNADEKSQRDDMNTVIRKLAAMRMPTAEGETQADNRLDQKNKDLIAEWRASRGKMRDLMRAAEKNPTDTKIGDRIVEAEKIEAALREQVLDMLQKKFAEVSAEQWRTSVKVGNLNDPDKMSPRSSFLEARTLPPETDTLMKDFMEANPIDLARGYVFSAVRRAEYAKRFGADSEKLMNMLRAAEKAGATSEETDMAKSAVMAATGRISDRYAPLQRARSFVFFFGNLALLNFAAFSSLAEPLVTGLRSGYARDGVKAVASNLSLMVRKGRREDMFEIARVIGLVNNALRDGFMENRTNADSMGMTKGFNRNLARFYQLNLLSPLTNFQRVATLPVAHSIIMRHLRNPKSSFAKGELNELGIGEADRADLLEWLEGFDGPPTAEDLLKDDGSFHPAGDLWASAIVRFTDTTIQNPQKSDRPIIANDPMYAALYGIMSFLISFQRNIINRTVLRQVGERGTFMGKSGQVAMNLANAAAPVALLYAGHFLSTVLREALINGDKLQELDDEDELMKWLALRAFYRTGLTGVLDPVTQIITGIKYETDITAALVGPYAATMARNVQTIIAAGAGRNSENTNTAEYNQAAAVYALIVQPSIAWGITSFAPTGPLSSFAFGTLPMWYAARYESRRDFAEAIVGPKGEKYDGDAPWWEQGD